jgi:hypothetical protein
MRIINNYVLCRQIHNLSNELNSLFVNSEIKIKQMLESSNIKTRNRNLTFKDVICYKFNSCFKHNTLSNVASNYNYNNNISCVKSSYYKKEMNIPIQYYKNIHKDILMLHNKYVEKIERKIIAVDGTYNNTKSKNKSEIETSLNMGYYDVSRRRIFIFMM